MRFIAVILGLVALVMGLSAIGDSTPSATEHHIAASIEHWRKVPHEKNWVLNLEFALEKERAARRIRATSLLGSCALLSLLAIGAWRSARAEYPFETRFFQPVRHTMLGTVRRFSATFLAREERIAEARSTLRPTLERLFGSKRE